MGAVSVDDITLAELKRVPVDGGDVLHALKSTDPGFAGFGEAYFSMIEGGAVKGWKRHLRMTLNLVVPIGDVRFVFFDEQLKRREMVVGDSGYMRITVPPMVWFGFQGLVDPYSLVLNVADLQHDPDEVERRSLEEFDFDWKSR